MEQEKSNLYKWGGWALIALIVFLGVETLSTLKNLPDINPVYNSISVTGEGEVVAVPDVATFNFSVSADASTVVLAQEAVTKKIDAILAELKKQGVEDKDVKTSNYNVYPKYRYENIVCITTPCPSGRQVQDGYTASHNVTVKVRETEKAGAVLGAVGGKGATNISGISFTQDDPQKSIDEARELAIEEAKKKAKELAKELDVRLVRLVSFYDNQGGYPVPYYGEAMGGDMMVKSASAPTIPIGENKTKVTVTLVYEIR